MKIVIFNGKGINFSWWGGEWANFRLVERLQHPPRWENHAIISLDYFDTSLLLLMLLFLSTPRYYFSPYIKLFSSNHFLALPITETLVTNVTLQGIGRCQ